MNPTSEQNLTNDTPSNFVHLHTHSHYSLLDGLAKIDELIDEVKANNMTAIALTDHGNLYGALEFYKKAKKAGIKPILGVEAYLTSNSRFDKTPTSKKIFHQILLAENNEGWHNLIKLVSLANLEGFYYKPRLDKELLRKYSKGIIATSSCLAGIIPQLILNNHLNEAVDAIKEFKDIFGNNNFFLELQHHPNIKEQIQVNKALIKLSKDTTTPLIASQDIHYPKPEDAKYHDILLAIQTGNTVDNEDRMSLRMDDFSLTPTATIINNFKDTPEAISNTVKIAERCNVEIPLDQVLLPKFPLPPEFKHNFDYLEHLARERLPKRYPNPSPEVNKRLEYELGIIKETGYAGYFLIVQDFINWAKDRGIAVGPGRGSAAGSLVSYSLGITDIDPLKYDLLFERFLNPERIQMPDIDIDFADTRRDEVLGYVRQKYGEDHVAQIITFGTMAARAAIRDSGRALNLSYGYCDKIAKLIPFNSKLREAIDTVPDLKSIYDNDPEGKKLLDTACRLEGVARHASMHACGTVIAPKPLTEYIPIQYSPQDNSIIITQFEGGAVESMGLLKMDFLGLKNLSIIEETVKLVKYYQQQDIDISNLSLDDKLVFELLQRGDTTGVFQFESSGMRRYMRELKPSEFEDLIAMVSLYRPGPMELLPTYIRRKHGQEEIKYLHPQLEPILKNTNGVGIYQEQMMRIARDLGGYSLGEADILRKAIGKKIKKLLDEQKVKLIDGMIKNGIDKKTAKSIWELFPPFARYGFNRSHAACYALIGYRTAYLRAHFPIEFNTGLMNADMRDIERLSFLISESRKSGIDVKGPDINKSMNRFTPDGSNIRFGLAAIKNVGHAIVDAIIEERGRGGEFKSLADFLKRIQHKDLNRKSLDSLIKAGALDSFGIERGQGAANLDNIIKFISGHRQASQNGHQSLFANQPTSLDILKLEDAPPATKKDQLLWEKELIGFYISEHPLDQHQERLKKYNVRQIKEVLETKNESMTIRLAGTISTIKKHLTKKGQPMLFVTMEDSNDPIEMMVFGDAVTLKPDAWQDNNVIIVEGRMSWRNDDPKFICNKVAEL